MKTQQNEGNIIRVSNLASIFSVSTQRVGDTTTGMKSSFIIKRHLQVTEGPQMFLPGCNIYIKCRKIVLILKKKIDIFARNFLGGFKGIFGSKLFRSE